MTNDYESESNGVTDLCAVTARSSTLIWSSQARGLPHQDERVEWFVAAQYEPVLAAHLADMIG